MKISEMASAIRNIPNGVGYISVSEYSKKCVDITPYMLDYSGSITGLLVSQDGTSPSEAVSYTNNDTVINNILSDIFGCVSSINLPNCVELSLVNNSSNNNYSNYFSSFIDFSAPNLERMFTSDIINYFKGSIFSLPSLSYYPFPKYFQNNVSIVYLPKLRGLYSIGGSDITNVTLGVTGLPFGVSLFQHCCSKITEINLPECEYIFSSGISAYTTSSSYHLSSLNLLSLPKCEYLFSNAIRLLTVKSLYLPNVKVIYSAGIFVGTSGPSVIDLPKCCYLYDGAMTVVQSCFNVNLPVCKYIGSSALPVSITVMDFPECEYIGEYNFRTNVSYVNLPKVRYLSGQSVFSGYGSYSSFVDFYMPNLKKYIGCSGSNFSGVSQRSYRNVDLRNYYCWDSFAQFICGGIYNSPYIEVVNLGFSSFIGIRNGSSTLREVYLSRVISLPAYFCSNASKLTKTYFPNVRYVGSYAFSGCTSLSSLSIDKVLTVSDWAFCNCISFSFISLPVCYSIGNSVFRSCTSLETVNLVNCSYVGDYAFADCTKLSAVYLPKISSLGQFAFTGCYSLSTIYISGVFSILSSVFSGSVGFRSLYLFGSKVCTLATNALSNTVFDNSYITGSFGSIYVPSSLLASYKQATNWAAFSDRLVGCTDDEIESIGASYVSLLETYAT